MPGEPLLKRKKLKTCYITSAGTSDLAPLLSYLRARGITPITPNVRASPGERHLDAVGVAIRRADLVIAVLSGEVLDQNIIFEVGYANGRGKPVVIIGPERVHLPSHMSGLMFIADGLTNPEGLKFNLDLFSEAPEKRRNSSAVSPTDEASSQTRDVRRLIAAWHSVRREQPASRLEEYVSELLKASGASVVTKSSTPERGADFAVWYDKLYPAIGGPLLIEVKSNLDSPAAAARARDQGAKYLELAHAHCLLVLYNRGIPDEEINAKFGSPAVLFQSIAQFEEGVKDSDGAAVIAALRNRLAHGVST